MKLGMPINNGFKVALATWQSWIENAVNPNRTRVFFRTFESTHWRSVMVFVDSLHHTFSMLIQSKLYSLLCILQLIYIAVNMYSCREMHITCIAI